MIITCYDTWKPVYAGGHSVNYWEARQCGRPMSSIYVHVEAGLSRRPCGVYMGSPTEREAR